MDRKMTERLIQAQEKLLTDPQYGQLQQEYQICNAAFASVVAQLPPEHQKIVGEYIGVCAEMHVRMLQIACGW